MNKSFLHVWSKQTKHMQSYCLFVLFTMILSFWWLITPVSLTPPKPFISLQQMLWALPLFELSRLSVSCTCCISPCCLSLYGKCKILMFDDCQRPVCITALVSVF